MAHTGSPSTKETGLAWITFRPVSKHAPPLKYHSGDS